MSESILNSIKKVLGVDESYTAFDTDIMMHINSVFNTLSQLGIGPANDSFMIEDAETKWDAFLGDYKHFNMVKSYMYLRVRLLFDPPSVGHHVTALEKQVQELEFRLHVQREEEPFGATGIVVVDGGDLTEEVLP